MYSQKNNGVKILLNVRWPVGGIRTYLRYVYRLFPSEDYSFTLLVPPNNNLDTIQNDFGSRLSNIVTCEPKARQMFVAITRLLRAEKYNLFHSHGLSSALFAALPLGLSSTPHIVTLHDVFSKNLFYGVRGRVKHFVIKSTLHLADVVHLLGNDPKENMEEFFPTVARQIKKLTVIKSGIEIDRFSGQKKEAVAWTVRAENSIASDKPILGFFGRFMSQKGFGTLVDAIQILEQKPGQFIVPTVMAFGGGGFLDREKRMLQERNLMQHFVFLPFLPNIADVLMQLDGVVMPSRWETAPILPMEVLVSGTPLIASDCIGLREMVEQTPAFVFNWNDSEKLAEAIQQWSADSRKDEFVAYAQHAALRFDVRRTATKMRQLYSELATGQPVAK